MTPVLVTAPDAEVVSVATLKTMLGLGAETADAVIEAARDAVVAEIDPASDGCLSRALRPATWELRGSDFGCGRIDLPYPPCTSIVSVVYDDAQGVEKVLAEHDDYRVFLRPLGYSFIAPVWNRAWPATRGDIESVRIRFVAGYAATPVDLMPKGIVGAIALGVRQILPMMTRDLTVSSDEVPDVRRVQYVVSQNASKVLEGVMMRLLLKLQVYG
ncbi:hypothetical protein [Rhodoplanes roseus]|uniref:Uncharacterized protein n=1 Tax=Rhodoplanes roseus TaxID=29409 RepID=A0A327L171_9BRAD|nr:hypothetical protein [Rhodoplanes roseus]RAI44709.1 hypothetical protein CH341_07790 [Rhodoplanes roseus]